MIRLQGRTQHQLPACDVLAKDQAHIGRLAIVDLDDLDRVEAAGPAVTQALGQLFGCEAEVGVVLDASTAHLETLLIAQPCYLYSFTPYLARQRARHADDAIAIANFQQHEIEPPTGRWRDWLRRWRVLHQRA
jgi:hypothetical protein